MYEVMIESSFSAAHQLKEYNGKCENLHGHNWRIQIWIRGNKIQSNGILIDFYEVEKILENVLQQIDHTNLNELQHFKEYNPTAENIAKYLFHILSNHISQENIRLYKVAVWESDKNMSAYFEE